jgi:hypothetical protein
VPPEQHAAPTGNRRRPAVLGRQSVAVCLHLPAGDGVMRVSAVAAPVVFCLDQGAFGDFSVDKPALLF